MITDLYSFNDETLITYRYNISYTSQALDKLASNKNAMAFIGSISSDKFRDKSLSSTREKFDENFKLEKKYSPDKLGFEDVSITA